jgi:hypothetical protein
LTPPPPAEQPTLPPPFAGPEDRAERRFWATGEYWLAWMQGPKVPPLVTTSPSGTDRTLAGLLGVPTTSILFGDGRVSEDARNGFRIGAGSWLDADRTLGVEAGFSLLESNATVFGAASDGTAILARPFFSALDNSSQSNLVAFPGSSSGSIVVRAESGTFSEAHVDFVEKFYDGRFRAESLLGYRYYRYDEGLNVQQLISPTAAPFVPGTQIATFDDFVTHNEFHGVDLGLRTQFRRDALSLDLLGKVAVGNLHRIIKINGGQTTSVPGTAPVTTSGGLLALSSNIQTTSNNEWSFLPEIGVSVGWRINPNLRVNLGYSGLFLYRIVRASEQVDLTVNPNLIPPATGTAVGPSNQPALLLNRDSAWIQGLTLGMEFTY